MKLYSYCCAPGPNTFSVAYYELDSHWWPIKKPRRMIRIWQENEYVECYKKPVWTVDTQELDLVCMSKDQFDCLWNLYSHK